MLADAKSQALSPRDTIALLQEMRPASNGSEDFRKSLENLSLVMQVANNLRANTEPQSASFFDAVGALISNGDFLGSIGTMIRKKAESAALMTQVQARKELATTARQMGYTPPASLPAQPATPTQVSAAQAPQASAPAAAATAAAPPVPPKPQRQFPPLPDNIGDFINKMSEAEDEAAQIQATMDMLVGLAGYNEWRPFVEQLFAFATKDGGDKQKTLGLLATLFRHLNAMQLLTVELGEKVFGAFEKHYVDIIAMLKGAPAPAPDPAVDPFGAALAVTEPVIESEEDEDEEDESDEDEEDESDEDEEEGEDEEPSE
jgi:hypothetical protein